MVRESVAAVTRDEEDRLLKLIPDEAWNALLEGDSLEAMKTIRRDCGLDLHAASKAVEKMKKMLGMSE